MSAALLLLCATLGGAVRLEVDATEGLDPAESAAMTRELSSITGEAPNGDRLTVIGVRLRRVSWRIQVSLERRDGALVRGREELDLTRDVRSWRAPLSEVLRRLLPEGRELATGRASPPPSAAVPAAAPPLPKVDPAPAPPLAAPAPERRSGFRVVPLLAIAAGVGGAIVGAKFVGEASSAIDQAPANLSIADLEAQQRAVFENAVIGSVVLSVGVATAVTGLVLLISD